MCISQQQIPSKKILDIEELAYFIKKYAKIKIKEGRFDKHGAIH